MARILQSPSRMKSIEICEGQKFTPYIVALEVTLRCNMRCLHCGSNADGNPREREMTLSEWKRVVDELIDLGAEYFTLSGGEPFVWAHWRELASHIRRREKVLSIISNGSLITDDDIRFLASIGMWNVALSIDGLAASHDRIRRMRGSFTKAIDALRRFKKTPIKVCVTTSVNRINFDDLPVLRAFLDCEEPDLWQVQVVNSFGRAGALKDEVLIAPEQYAALVDFIRESQRMKEEGSLSVTVMPADSIGYCHGAAAEIWGDVAWSGCNAGRYVVGIQSNGDVVGCLSLQGKDFVAGNLLKRPLSSIWGDDEAFAYNRTFSPENLRGPCRGCSSGSDCRSGCLGMGFSTSGELYHNAYCYKHLREDAAHAAIAC